MSWIFAAPLLVEAGVRTGLFDLLEEEPRTIAQIAAATGASKRGLAVLMYALAGLELLHRDETDRFGLTPESAAFLVSSKPEANLGKIFSHISTQLIPAWLGLVDVVRTGRLAIHRNSLSEEDAFFAGLVEAILPLGWRAASALAEHLKIEEAEGEPSVLDIGAGSGVYSIPLAQRSSRVRITAVDLPEVLKVTQRIADRSTHHEMTLVLDRSFEAAAIDLGTHTEDGLKVFQAQQAEKMTANLTDDHKEELKAQVRAARKTFEGFKLPVMVQAILTFEFIFDILEYGTMYYATRRPTELGKFNWVIDAKGNMEQPNDWEEWWSKFIFPVLQTRSFTRPFRQLPVGIGDYSHFKRFETKADPFLRKMSGWKEGDPEPLDLGLVIKESFTFSSEAKLQLELVDIITNATRRARRPRCMRDRPGAWLQDAVLKMGPISAGHGSTSSGGRGHPPRSRPCLA